MKKIFLFCALIFFFLGNTTYALEYQTATVTSSTPIIQSELTSKGKYETLTVERKNGEIISLETGDIFEQSALHSFTAGDKIIIAKGDDGEWIFTDRYRIPALAWILGVFILMLLLFARKKGLLALIGLGITIVVIFYVLLPGLQHNVSPVLLSLLVATLIGAGAMGLSHGFNITSRISLASILVTLLVASGLSFIATWYASIFGLGSETTWEIGTGILEGIDFRGIFLIGITIGALGILDDVTITQVSAVQELKKSNPSFTWKELFIRALRIGKDHLVSVINTLVLAYTASSLPIFLLLSVSQTPWWVLINSEIIAEEIIRTLVGSGALILAIPLSTFFAAKYFESASCKQMEAYGECGHHH